MNLLGSSKFPEILTDWRIILVTKPCLNLTAIPTARHWIVNTWRQHLFLQQKNALTRTPFCLLEIQQQILTCKFEEIRDFHTLQNKQPVE